VQGRANCPPAGQPVSSRLNRSFPLSDNPTNARDLLVAAMRRIADGDRAALQTAYRLTSAKLFGVCLRILHERTDAEDVLQEVYLTVWQKAAGFDPARASPMTWLITIARNKAIDRLRAGGRSRRMAPIDSAAEIADAAPLADDTLMQGQANAKLKACLAGLTAPEQNSLRGAFFDGNTYEELAARTDTPLGTLKSRIRRALQKLRACLER
jgi:RNA polymerase sigma-70 factor (ECF subfamily)